MATNRLVNEIDGGILEDKRVSKRRDVRLTLDWLEINK